MLDIQKKQVELLLTVLNKAGAQYKIILDDGTEYGELQVQAKKEMKRRSSLLPRGTLTNHYIPYVSSMQVGEVTSIPCTGFDAESLRSSLSSWIHHHWGASAGTTMINRRTGDLEVLRLK
jgi:hypothetical protein